MLPSEASRSTLAPCHRHVISLGVSERTGIHLRSLLGRSSKQSCRGSLSPPAGVVMTTKLCQVPDPRESKPRVLRVAVSFFRGDGSTIEHEGDDTDHEHPLIADDGIAMLWTLIGSRGADRAWNRLGPDTPGPGFASDAPDFVVCLCPDSGWIFVKRDSENGQCQSRCWGRALCDLE